MSEQQQGKRPTPPQVYIDCPSQDATVSVGGCLSVSGHYSAGRKDTVTVTCSLSLPSGGPATVQTGIVPNPSNNWCFTFPISTPTAPVTAEVTAQLVVNGADSGTLQTTDFTVQPCPSRAPQG